MQSMFNVQAKFEPESFPLFMQNILLWYIRNDFLFPYLCVLHFSRCFPLWFLRDSSVTVHSLHLNSMYRPFGWTCCCYFTSDLRHKSSLMFPLLEPILAPYEALYCCASLSSSCSCLLLRIKIGSRQFLDMGQLGEERGVFLKYVFIFPQRWCLFFYAWMLSCFGSYREKKHESQFGRRCEQKRSHNHKSHQK